MQEISEIALTITCAYCLKTALTGCDAKRGITKKVGGYFWVLQMNLELKGSKVARVCKEEYWREENCTEEELWNSIKLFSQVFSWYWLTHAYEEINQWQGKDHTKYYSSQTTKNRNSACSYTNSIFLIFCTLDELASGVSLIEGRLLPLPELANT